MTDNEMMTPLFVLAVSVAYEIQANKKTSRQEKARMVTLFGKLVENDVLSETELQIMTQKAFSYAGAIDVKDFLERVAPLLSQPQKLAVLINLWDTMLVDGHTTISEHEVVKKFQRAFKVDEQTMRGIKDFLMLKNDTSMFLDSAHPLNIGFFDIKGLFSKT